MDQDYRYKFEEMLENNPAQPFDAAAGKGDANSTAYAAPSNTRNIAFIQADKSFIFLNYSYLVSVKYKHSDNQIDMVFTTHVVKLKGLRLEMLAYELMQHLPRIITCTEERYNALEETKPIINSIEVTEQ